MKRVKNIAKKQNYKYAITFFIYDITSKIIDIVYAKCFNKDEC
jgi:hypothetical protein